MNGLDLFSGIGGLTLALAPWVRPVAYCENDRYVQGVLLSRMEAGDLPIAPIWDDVRTLKGIDIPSVDIIYGGFPCQDISCAGRGAGLEGERSGLFFEIMRLTDELRPSFIFLENVPAILTRGFDRVLGEITQRRYDARWMCLSASDVGAPHIRNRWWLLAYSPGEGGAAHADKRRESIREGVEVLSKPLADGEAPTLADADREGGLQPGRIEREERRRAGDSGCKNADADSIAPGRPTESWCQRGYWSTEPDVGRVANGISARMDRLRGLGNAVVPLQARTAFEILSGLRGAA